MSSFAMHRGPSADDSRTPSRRPDLARGVIARGFRALRACLALLAIFHAAVGVCAEPSDAGHPALWRVRSGTNSVWLFGSIHVALPSFFPLPRAVEDALDGADVLAVELDVEAASPDQIAEFRRLLTYEPPDGLERHVKASTWGALEALARKTGQTTSEIRRMKPMLVVTGLGVGDLRAHGYRLELGVDGYLLNRAHRMTKEIVELESFELQARIMAGVSDEEGDTLVSTTIESVRSGEFIAQFEALLDAWRRGDTAAMERLIFESDADPLSIGMNRQLFDERNRAMADKIRALARSGRTAMVVVGAGHFVGAAGIVELLKADGFTVERVSYDAPSEVTRPTEEPETAR